MSRSGLFAGLIISLALGASACGDETVATPTTSKPPPPRAAAPAAQTAPPVDLSQLPAREFRESDFVETDASRDPFRSFEQLFADKGKLDQPMQRHVLIDQYSLDELRLVGVISRGSPRALLVDPTGFGWSAKVGDFIGKPEVLHLGGPSGSDVAVNWRIDRVRESDVVLVREDTSHPEIPATTRVLALYPDGDEGLSRK